MLVRDLLLHYRHLTRYIVGDPPTLLINKDGNIIDKITIQPITSYDDYEVTTWSMTPYHIMVLLKGDEQ